MILNIPKLNIHIEYIMYLVEAYLSYNDYLEGESSFEFIFKSREEWKRIFLDFTFFTTLYIVYESEIMENKCNKLYLAQVYLSYDAFMENRPIIEFMLRSEEEYKRLNIEDEWWVYATSGNELS